MSVQIPPGSLVAGFGPLIFEFIRRVGPFLSIFGGRVTVNSWWRSIVDNARAGGSKSSQHLWALAADLQTNELTDIVIALAPRFGLIASRISRTAVHIQLLDAGVLEQFGIAPLETDFA